MLPAHNPLFSARVWGLSPSGEGGEIPLYVESFDFVALSVRVTEPFIGYRIRIAGFEYNSGSQFLEEYNILEMMEALSKGPCNMKIPFRLYS